MSKTIKGDSPWYIGPDTKKNLKKETKEKSRQKTKKFCHDLLFEDDYEDVEEIISSKHAYGDLWHYT